MPLRNSRFQRESIYSVEGSRREGAMRMPPVPRLVASRVSCMRSGQVIIREVNMTLHEGGAMLLTGPNASGKSTFLRLLASFIQPSAANFCGTAMICLYLVFTMHFWEMLEGLEGRTMGALEYMGLGDFADRKGAALSLGQRKRLQLARLLAIPRPVWLLDEPSVGLDTKGLELLEQIIADHRRKGGMVLVATHIPIDLEDCMDLRFPPRVRETVQPFGGPS